MIVALPLMASAEKLQMVRVLESQTIAIADFTDNTDATGYIDFDDALPANAMVIGWKAVVSTAFAGDTTSVMQVGVSGDVNKYSANTAQSCHTAGTLGSLALAVDAVTGMSTAKTPRVTITEDSDFGDITTGSMKVYIYYIDCR